MTTTQTVNTMPAATRTGTLSDTATMAHTMTAAATRANTPTTISTETMRGMRRMCRFSESSISIPARYPITPGR